MENLEISLIYPDMESLSNGVDGVDKANISTEVLDEIQLTTILELKSGRLCDFFTKDIRVIEYRQKVFEDMIENPELCDLFEKVSPILSDISDFILSKKYPKVNIIFIKKNERQNRSFFSVP